MLKQFKDEAWGIQMPTGKIILFLLLYWPPTYDLHWLLDVSKYFLYIVADDYNAGWRFVEFLFR